MSSEHIETLKRPWYFISWRFIAYPILLIVAVGGTFLSMYAADTAIELKQQNEAAIAQEMAYQRSFEPIQDEYLLLVPKIELIDSSLPGLSTSELDLLSEHLSQSIKNKDVPEAQKTLNALSFVVEDVLANQQEIAKKEVVRMQALIKEHRAEIDLVLGDQSVLPADAEVQLANEEIPVMTRIGLARGWVSDSTAEITRRREIMDSAQKSILIDKSDLLLYMYENDEVVYQMPVSLGTSQYPTRSGDFAIQSKEDLVWSYWQIWLPNWLGIYYAGASENGIHGLPYDNAGNVYWASSVGKENITRGCVMPNNENMRKLYNWAEIGVPVTIVS